MEEFKQILETVMTYLHQSNPEAHAARMILATGLIFIVGYYFGRVAGLVKLPEITGYIIAGIFLGKAFSIIPEHIEENLSVFVDIALGLIALTIGGEFSLRKLKRLGKEVVIITVIQILGAFTLVTGALILFKVPPAIAMLAGAIASATAPAATVHIVQSLKAHGKFIDYLYGVVALDDAGCVILFSIIFSFASPMLGAAEAGHGFLFSMLHLLEEIVIGAIGGLLIFLATRNRKNGSERLIITLGIFLAYTGFALALGMSPLLTNMVAGAILINLSPKNHRIFKDIEPLTPPLYAIFFILAGIELEPRAFLSIETLTFGAIYILMRAVGKFGGVYAGCLLSRTDTRVRNYLGFCMLPQAGVAIGLKEIVMKMHVSPEMVPWLIMLSNMILMSVFVNELIGPPVSKFAVIRGNRMEVR